MSQPNQPQQPEITLNRRPEYRDGYANSVQVRISFWDFLLVFGTLEQQTRDAVTIDNFQGVYLSPQQAKALFNVLGANLQQYEAAFGAIKLENAQEPDPAEPRFVVPAKGFN